MPRLLRRAGVCRRTWRRTLVLLVAVAVLWTIAGLTGTQIDQKLPSGNSRISKSVQAGVIADLSRADSSKNTADSSSAPSNLRHKLGSDENVSKVVYDNIVFSQVEQLKSGSKDTVEGQSKSGAGEMREIFDALNEKEIQEAERDFALRRTQVRETCSKYGLGKYKTNSTDDHRTYRYPPTANYDVLYINRRDGFTYCPVYKAASTSWRHYLCLLAGADQAFLSSTSQQISTIARRLWPQLDYDEASMAVPTTLKFMLVRHPFERIVSAYRDKLENINIGREHGVLHFYESYGKKIVRKYRPKNATVNRVLLDEVSDLSAPSGVEPTFQEFVRYLIDTDLVHHADDHWMPYYLYCTPCFIEYDVIAHFDSLERDQKYILHRLKLDKNMQRPQWKHLTKGKKTSAIVDKYLSTLSKVQKYQLYEKYKIDFEMFGFRL